MAGPGITIQCSLFNLSDALNAWEDQDQYDPFNSSPLTTPEPTPPPSPQPAVASLYDGPSGSNILPQHPPRTNKRQAEMEFPDCSEPSQDRRQRLKTDHRRKHQYTAYRAARAKKRKSEKSGPKAKACNRPNMRARDIYVATAQHIPAALDAAEQPAARTGYSGLRDHIKSRKVHRLEELVGPTSKLGFKLIEWDGRTPMFITDAQGRICVICAGHPDDRNWDRLQKEAMEAMESARKSCSVSATQKPNRRGDFTSLATGVSHGGGQTKPCNLKDEKNAEVLETLNSLKPFQRLSGFATSVLSTWAPDLCNHYCQMKEELFDKTTGLTPVFPASAFCAATYNVGPRTTACRHKDHQNLPYGYCAVTSLGSFDYVAGGHIVLWEMKIVIEFPAGSTILLPSALITHSNTAIARHERRYSFTQYTAGGLFRWVDNKCMKQDDYLASLTPSQLKAWQDRSQSRMGKGLALLPILRRQTT